MERARVHFADIKQLKRLVNVKLVGSGNTIEYAEDCTVYGNNNRLTDGHRVVFVGTGNVVTHGCNISNAVVLGDCRNPCPLLLLRAGRVRAGPTGTAAPQVIAQLLSAALTDMANDCAARFAAPPPPPAPASSAWPGPGFLGTLRSGRPPGPAVPAAAAAAPPARNLRLDRPVDKWAVHAKCDICMELGPLLVFAPCGHSSCCQDCATRWRATLGGSDALFTCPLCRSGVDGVAFIKAPTRDSALDPLAGAKRRRGGGGGGAAPAPT